MHQMQIRSRVISLLNSLANFSIDTRADQHPESAPFPFADGYLQSKLLDPMRNAMIHLGIIHQSS